MTQLQALLLSLMLELPVVFLCVGVGRWLPRTGWRRLVIVGLAATLVSHPFAWAGFGVLRPVLPSFWLRALLIEGAVALFEGVLYARVARLGWLRGLAVGLAANAWSFGVGLVIMEWLAAR